ncbi:helix-turn-helix domain-containing protein [Flavobacterium cerinum]|uniref:Helix-turn-helix domain-containing protein n=1 Tax=Flavobacterium cerinum TaxID=2502784 RepID=A0A3S3U534_9FLAO|nr:pentapeptide repeat-containing protein [Flavobacterium cerinum]RWX03472.1 helix-turn-helix domain-containing protein [Flavobacterium cerinum]
MLSTKTIGNKIAEARRKINVSQAQLAERLFISPQAVGKWERGESMPDITTLNRLAEILGVDLNYFSENFQSVATDGEQVKKPEESETQEKKLSWDMSRGNWVDADFSGLKNLHEKFSSSNMQRSKFIGSDMSGLLLKNNNVENCDFSGSDISGSHIHNSHMVNNIFKDCLLKETEFSGSHIKGCDFSDADFTGVVFKSCSFQKNVIANAVWKRTSFNATQIDNMVFEGTLEDCYFENSAFSKVTFQNSKLINIFFKSRSLKQIRFIDCEADRMTYEFLKNGKADVTGIKLLS